MRTISRFILKWSLAGALIAPALESGAQDPWPAEPLASAANLTAIEGAGANEFYNDLSGAAWNPETRTLWLCRNGAGAASRLWAVVEDGAGGYVIDERLGNRGEWASVGDVEGVTQADFLEDVVYLIVEGEERIREYDVSTYGTAILNNVWNTRPFLPLSGNDGAEGIAFVPDEALAASGFVDPNGVPYASTGGMGGVMMVGHQNGGAIFVFDLDRSAGTFAFVGEYRTGYTETAELHFDRSTGVLHVWHGASFNVLELSDLSSDPVPGQTYRQLGVFASYDGPSAANYEGFTLVSAADCDAGRRSCFMTIDDGLSTSLVLFEEFTLGCPPLDCLDGTVDDAGGVPAEVLLVNGSPGNATHDVFAATLSPITIALDPSPAGSGAGRYFLYIWPGGATNPVNFMRGAEVLGCLGNPSPLQGALAPQPIRCLRGNGVPAGVCGGVLELNPPGTNFVPWSITKPGGFAAPITILLQGVLEDQGASNTAGFSVTNGVRLVVQ